MNFQKTDEKVCKWVQHDRFGMPAGGVRCVPRLGSHRSARLAGSNVKCSAELNKKPPPSSFIQVFQWKLEKIMGHLHSSIITMCFKLVHSKIARANGNGLIVSVSKPLLLLCLKLCLMLFVLSLPKLNFGSFHKYPPTNKIFISLIKIVCPGFL